MELVRAQWLLRHTTRISDLGRTLCIRAFVGRRSTVLYTFFLTYVELVLVGQLLILQRKPPLLGLAYPQQNL